MALLLGALGGAIAIELRMRQQRSLLPDTPRWVVWWCRLASLGLIGLALVTLGQFLFGTC